MSGPERVAFIGNSLPRRCGIATFTSDLRQAVSRLAGQGSADILAMTDRDEGYDYPAEVIGEVRSDQRADYERAARLLNGGDYAVASLQHEFGIYGGEAGGYLLDLLVRLRMPIVTTLHTVLAQPGAAQRAVLGGILDASSRVVVMARKGRQLLEQVYGQAPGKVLVIPHGTPDVPFCEPDEAKAELGYAGRPVILTFGLLSPSKGIEVMIEAMPAILAQRPDALYVVLGATHPNLVRQHGEAYRASLQERVRALGLGGHVVFLDRFVDQPLLLRHITMCDVYVTPYLNEAQMTSGTLAWSFGLGKAVVSTPYWHARELLADGRGVLVPFGDVAATGLAVAGLLTDGVRRLAMRERAYDESRAMTWPRVAASYRDAFRAARAERSARAGARRATEDRIRGVLALPEVRVDHLQSMCDETGLLQHARQGVADRSHGYCTDDNARALLVACALAEDGEQPLPAILSGRFAAFLQHAWNPDVRRFRNFLGFDRRWLEDMGSEDSHGRALWALGECARSALGPALRRWALALFAESMAAAEAFRSPRACSFVLLGLDAYCEAAGRDLAAGRLRQVLATRLLGLHAAVRSDDWDWFEEGLAYDNARLSQALLVTGHATGERRFLEAGLRTLRWLAAVQTSPEGRFRPVGSQGFAARRARPMAFDQQPLEATATVCACLSAWRADSDPAWWLAAHRAFAWYLGGNDLLLSLVDPDTGACADGLHPDRANGNQGGESAVSWLLAVAQMRQLARLESGRILRNGATQPGTGQVA